MGIEYADTPTPAVGKEWTELSELLREIKVAGALIKGDFNKVVSVHEVLDSGHIILSLTKPLPANIRGVLLLNIEKYLKEHIDQGLTVWLDPQGDKSSLRNLRGIEIKS